MSLMKDIGKKQQDSTPIDPVISFITIWAFLILK